MVPALGAHRRAGVGRVSDDKGWVSVRALHQGAPAIPRRRLHDSSLCRHRVHRDILIRRSSSSHSVDNHSMASSCTRIDEQPDLLTWKDNILKKYYREETLVSLGAKHTSRLILDRMGAQGIP